MTEKEQRWNKIKELFDAALEHESSQRDAFLRNACETDQELRAEIESLLSAYQKAGSLSRPPWLEQSVKDVHEQKFIGAYRLETKLGEGGMGQVWLAEQTAPVRRRVALKLIRGGMFDSSALQRFQSERQSLAIMDHPSIAKVFDAGATTDGQPYFVMEYVPGLPITDYCDQKRLKIRERLELFIQACEGVQHAHQKAIIHRDLKPANILVVEVDGKPMPRIIDFGLAKAATPQSDGQTLYTQIGSFVGTPGYMSPEQADLSVKEIDTRTDVYSLGVVLYVLLTGSLPFDTQQKRPLDEVLRQLREEDPPRPSTRVSAERATSATTAAERGTEPKQLTAVLRGDLDWITMKAVERDRAHRYGTPSELAADIGRYLRNEPVGARPASTSYRLRKYVRRHRISVAAALVIAGLLVTFAVVQAVELRRITRARDRANRITDFMTSMFKVSDPSEARGNSITAREILDKASKEIDSGLAKDPEVQAQMMYVMGDVYMSLGLYSQTQALLVRAVEAQRRFLGPENPDTLRSASLLGGALLHQGHYAEAEKLLRETLAIQRRVLGPEHGDTLSSMGNLGWILSLESHDAEAEKLTREALEIRWRVLGPEHGDTLSSMDNLAWILSRKKHDAEAEKLTRETLEIRRRIFGAEHPDTLSSMDRLAFELYVQHRCAEAEKLEREALVIKQRVLGPEHPGTLDSMHILAIVLRCQGHYPEAEKLQRGALVIKQRVLGPEHPDTLDSMNSLAADLIGEGHYREAEELLRETRAIQQRVLGSEHPVTAATTYNLGRLAAVQGLHERALSLLREAVDHGLGPHVALGMEKDEGLKSLYGDARFAALVAHAKDRAGATAAQKVN